MALLLETSVASIYRIIDISNSISIAYIVLISSKQYRIFRYIAIIFIYRDNLNLQQHCLFPFSNQLNYLQKFRKELGLGMNNFSIFSMAAISSSTSSLLYAFVIIDTRQRQVTVSIRESK